MGGDGHTHHWQFMKTRYSNLLAALLLVILVLPPVGVADDEFQISENIDRLEKLAIGIREASSNEERMAGLHGIRNEFETDNPIRRANAIATIGRLADVGQDDTAFGAESIRVVIRGFSDVAAVSQTSVRVFGRLKGCQGAKQNLTEVAKLLASENEWVAVEAAETIALFGPNSLICLDQLIKALDRVPDGDGFSLRISAANAIGKVGTAAKHAIPRLVKGCKSTNEDIRLASAVALLRIEPTNQTAFDTIKRSLLEAKLHTKSDLLVTLADPGVPRNKAVIELMRFATNDENEIISANAERFLQDLMRHSNCSTK